MKAFLCTLLASAALLTSALPTAPDGCFAPQAILPTYAHPFTLTLVSSKSSDPLTFTRIDPSTYAVGIDHAFRKTLMLTDGTLSVQHGGEKAFLVTPRDRAAFREVRFGKKQHEEPEAFEMTYKCIDGKARMVVRPQEAGTFCVYKNRLQAGSPSMFPPSWGTQS